MQRSLTSFFNNPHLSDIEIKNPASEATYKCHKVVLASASDLFNTLLTENDPAILKSFTLPKHIKTTSNLLDDPLPKLMHYIYSNQNFEGIRQDIEEHNVLNFYSLSQTLKVSKLKADLEKLIVDNFLSPDTCTNFYNDAIKFESQYLKEACRDMIVSRFDDIIRSKTEGSIINDLPFEEFHDLVSSENLNVSEEYEVVKVINRYLNHRKTLPLLEEEDPAQDWSNLTEQEKAQRAELKAKTQEEEKKKEEEEKKKETEAFEKLDELAKIQQKVDQQQEQLINTMSKRFEVKRLTKEQKDKLFKDIRYSYLKHEELIETSMNPDFAAAKDQILQGLSYRLNPYEKTSFKEFSINMKPRKNYGAEMEQKLIDNFAQNRQSQHDQQIQGERQLSQASASRAQTQMRESQTPGVDGGYMTRSNLQAMRDQQQMPDYQTTSAPGQHTLDPRPQQQFVSPTNDLCYNQNLRMDPLDQEFNNAYLQQHDGLPLNGQGVQVQESAIDRQRREDFQRQLRLQQQAQDMEVGGVVAQSKFSQKHSAKQVLDPHFKRQQMQIQDMQASTMHHPNEQNYLRNSASDINLHPQLAATQTSPYKHQQHFQMQSQVMPKAPQKEAYNVHAQTSFSPKKQTTNPYQTVKSQDINDMYGTQMQSQKRQAGQIEFVYAHDFDENGALYYLGTCGMRKIWQNPHKLNLVQCFASSVGSGQVEDIVGRQVVNCRTLNEPFSYFGVDLGEGRFIVPTCYSLKNRNSTTHVLMNWHFEASNDKVNWTVLDRRIYLSDNQNYNQEMEEEQKSLKKKGATSTWGIDQTIYNEVGQQGFRYFRVVQVGKNSSGSDNLTLSGFEIYGKAVHNAAWEF